MNLRCLCGKLLNIELVLEHYGSVKCGCGRLWILELVLFPKLELDPEVKIIENGNYEVV